MSLSQSFSQKIGNVRPLNPCPSLDIDFANGGYVTDLGFADQASVGSANFNIGAFNGPDPVFTRSSAATFRGSNGLIQYAPENLLLRSEDFGASWAKTVVTLSNGPASPSGGVSKTITGNGSSNTNHIYGTGFTGAIGQAYTASVYAKYSDRQWLWVRADLPNTLWVAFDIQNGLVGGSIGSYVSTQIESAGNGWFRCSVTWICSTTIATGSVVFNIGTGPTPTGASITATGSIHLWGAQVERSSTARPYISTTALPVYGPRFEYDLSGNKLGLLMEEQSENLLQYSEQFDNAYWNKTGAPISITANSINAPNGLPVSDRMFETTDNLAHATFTDSSNPSIASGLTYSLSVFCKKGTGATAPDWVQVFPRSAGFANLEYANFNISTGSTGTYSGSIAPKIEHVGNGWYRCIMFATATSTTSTNTGFTVGFANNNGASLRLPTYVGSITSDVYIWGAQMEQKPFATSYIPTVGGTTTRNADVVNSTVGSWFNQTEGTVVVSGDRNNNPTLNTSGLDSFFEFTGTASYLLVHACDGTTEAVYDAAGSPATTVGVTIGSLTSIAASYSDTTDLLHISRNGLATQSGASTGLGVTPTTLNIGYAPSNSIGYWNGHIKSFRYFPKALPNNLQRLSS